MKLITKKPDNYIASIINTITFITVGIIFIYIGYLSNENIKIVFIILGLLTIIMGIICFISTHKKERLRKNKYGNQRIEAKITAFCSIKTKNYYFIASDGINEYKSESFSVRPEGYIGDIPGTLKQFNIDYNPNDKNQAIKDVEQKMKELNYKNSNLLKFGINKINYVGLKHLKEYLEKGDNSYVIINGHKLSIGDKVNVYIGQQNPGDYRVDTDFLYYQ